MPGLRISISAEAANRNKLINPGWHSGEIESFDFVKNKSAEGSSWVCLIKTIDDPANNGAVKRVSWSEKYPEYMSEFLLALGFEKNPDGSINVDIPDISALKGRKINFKTSRGEFQGRDQDNVQNFMPYGSL